MIKYILGGDSKELIRDSKAIIGFNSTALVEGLILRKPVIVPCFGIKKNSLIICFVISSCDELLRFLTILVNWLV